MLQCPDCKNLQSKQGLSYCFYAGLMARRRLTWSWRPTTMLLMWPTKSASSKLQATGFCICVLLVLCETRVFVAIPFYGPQWLHYHVLMHTYEFDIIQVTGWANFCFVLAYTSEHSVRFSYVTSNFCYIGLFFQLSLVLNLRLHAPVLFHFVLALFHFCIIAESVAGTRLPCMVCWGANANLPTLFTCYQ